MGKVRFDFSKMESRTNVYYGLFRTIDMTGDYWPAADYAALEQRLADEEADNKRMHEEKMKFWHNADDLRRRLAEVEAENKRLREFLELPSISARELAEFRAALRREE